MFYNLKLASVSGIFRIDGEVGTEITVTGGKEEINSALNDLLVRPTCSDENEERFYVVQLKA
jgi:hypothetical protein